MFYPVESDILEIFSRVEKDLNSFKGSTLFLTGAGGFLGRYFINLIDHFNKNNDQKIKVIGIDNFVSSGEFGKDTFNQTFENIKMIAGDLTDPNGSQLKLAQDAEIIIHAAGIASPKHYKAKPLETIDIAVNGTRSLLETCKISGSKFIFFSSSEIYGNPPPNEIPIRETFKGLVSSIGPRACYDESKRLGETLCTVYSDLNNIHTNIIRPFNVYGPGMQRKDYRVMPNFAFRVKDRKKLEVYGSGNQTRTYCYITDAISGFLKVFFRGKAAQAYNIGNPREEISANSLAMLFQKKSDHPIEIEIMDHPSSYPDDEPDRRCPNIEKAQNDLFYNPVIDLNTGVDRFLKYVCQ